MKTSSPGIVTTSVRLTAAIAVLVAGWGGITMLSGETPVQPAGTAPMLLAPMIAVGDTCLLLPQRQSIEADDLPNDSLTRACTGPNGSAAQLVDSTLAALQPGGVDRSPRVGYTLPAPLLQLFRQEAGAWVIDAERVQRIVRTVRDSSRPVILYLFATHFATDAPLEAELANDSDNLAQTRDGPMAQSRYYDSAINNWTFATTRTELTARRKQATAALLDELCRLPAQDLAKIKGVTLLGELHHLFPDFEAGMGFDRPYRVTDYSAESAAAFRAFLKTEFSRIEQLNRVLGANYRSFDEIRPPSRDTRSEPLERYTEHIDSFAHGTLPVSGWAFANNPLAGGPAWVHVYLNGDFVGKTRADKGRQDVLAAKPEFGTANTGWRLNLDYRRLPSGMHRVDVFLESSAGRLTALGTRGIAVMDKHQRTPALRPQKPLPDHAPLDNSLQAHIDEPRDQASYYYNPLVPLWHTFRGKQVADYLRHFDDAVNQSCLAATPHYTHQIIPFTNPSWDENKFAIDASLKKKHTGNIRLGVSLYGDASYGNSLRKWLPSTGHRNYGVTEFHPLKAMSAEDLGEVLDMHARQGAEFLSFFVEPYWQGHVVARDHNLFSFDPENQQFGSDRLYEAVREHLAQPTR
ncbi:MAG: hypothetical protein EOO23_01650 [Comamonadaceae bacterium]|nr:MAG: hypothetical protein EOO23_01650 [Comamonadaceae bacterium]